MRADRISQTAEENYLHDIGLKLGLNPALIEDLIRVMKSYVDVDIPSAAMLEKVKKYLNLFQIRFVSIFLQGMNGFYLSFIP